MPDPVASTDKTGRDDVDLLTRKVLLERDEFRLR